MRKTNRYKKINGRKKRTLKMRGGDLDDPDTKEYLNSKFTALEQKITELENNMPVQIGYKVLAYHSPVINGAGPSYTPLVVNKNINVNEFWKYVGKGSIDYGHYPAVTIFLPALYSLPNVRGLNINVCVHSFSAGNAEDNELLSARNLEALNAKYPGLFTL